MSVVVLSAAGDLSLLASILIFMFKIDAHAMGQTPQGASFA